MANLKSNDISDAYRSLENLQAPLQMLVQLTWPDVDEGRDQGNVGPRWQCKP